MASNTIFVIGILLLFATTSTWADDVKDRQFMEKITKRIQDKCKGSKNYQQCRYDESPSKCKQLSFGEDIGAWYRCVRTCANAGIISKTIGECS